MDQDQQEFNSKVTSAIVITCFVLGLHHAYLRRIRKQQKVMLGAIQLLIENLDQQNFDRIFNGIVSSSFPRQD